MKFQIVPVTAYEQNCSVLWCEKTLRAAIVDPGGDVARISRVVEKLGVEPERIFLTHGHLDHVGGTLALAARFGIPVEGPHREDRFLLDTLSEQARIFGFPDPGSAIAPDRWLQEGDVISFGDEHLEVLHCPGHTPGHLVFFHRETPVAFVGDVLFRGSIGRTDFVRGDFNALIRSIRDKLFPLGDDVAFVPGHGPMSDFGTERRTNPFVSGRFG